MFKPTTLTNTLLRSSSRMASVVAAPRFTAAAGPSTLSSVLPSKRAYHEKVLDHYNKPRNVRSSYSVTAPLYESLVVDKDQADDGRMDRIFRGRQVGSMSKTDQDVGTGLVGAPGTYTTVSHNAATIHRADLAACSCSS